MQSLVPMLLIFMIAATIVADENEVSQGDQNLVNDWIIGEDVTIHPKAPNTHIEFVIETLNRNVYEGSVIPRHTFEVSIGTLVTYNRSYDVLLNRLQNTYWTDLTDLTDFGIDLTEETQMFASPKENNQANDVVCEAHGVLLIFTRTPETFSSLT